MPVLLRPIDAPGLPRDWLQARRFPCQPSPVLHPWHEALAEARWLYLRLDTACRSDYAPLVALCELRPFMNALRLASGGDSAAAATALSGSLLHPELIEITTADETAAQRLTRLARHPECASLPGWDQSRALSGLRSFERALRDGILIAGRRGNQLGATIFSRLIDLRNITTLAKAERWGGIATILPGGSLTGTRLTRPSRSEEALNEPIELLLRYSRLQLRSDPLAIGSLAARLIIRLIEGLRLQFRFEEAT